MKRIKRYLELINEGVGNESLIRFISDAFFEYVKDNLLEGGGGIVEYKMKTILNRYLTYPETDSYIKDFITLFKKTIKEDDVSPSIKFILERPFRLSIQQDGGYSSSNGGYDFHGDKSIYINIFEMGRLKDYNGVINNDTLKQIKSTLVHETKHFVDDILSNGKHLGNQDDLDYFERPYEINARLSSFYSKIDSEMSFSDVKEDMIKAIKSNVWDKLSQKDKKKYIRMTYKMYSAVKSNDKLYNAIVKSNHPVINKKDPIIVNSDTLANGGDKILKKLNKDLDKSINIFLKKYKIDFRKPTIYSPNIIEIRSTLIDLFYFDINSGNVIYPLFTLIDKALKDGYIILIPYASPSQLLKFEKVYTQHNILEVVHRKINSSDGNGGRYWMISINSKPNIPRTFEIVGEFNRREFGNSKATKDALEYSKGKDIIHFNNVKEVVNKGELYIKNFLQTLIDTGKPMSITLNNGAILKELKYKGEYILGDTSLYLRPYKFFDESSIMSNITNSKLNLKTNIKTYDELINDPSYVKENGLTVFKYASNIGSLGLVKKLIDNGFSKDDIDWCILLQHINNNDNYDIVKYLINIGVDVNKKNQSSSWSALMNACNSLTNYVNVTRLLLDNGANPTYTDPSYGNTPLSIAKDSDIISMIEDKIR